MTSIICKCAVVMTGILSQGLLGDPGSDGPLGDSGSKGNRGRPGATGSPGNRGAAVSSSLPHKIAIAKCQRYVLLCSYMLDYTVEKLMLS